MVNYYEFVLISLGVFYDYEFAKYIDKSMYIEFKWYDFLIINVCTYLVSFSFLNDTVIRTQNH